MTQRQAAAGRRSAAVQATSDAGPAAWLIAALLLAAALACAPAFGQSSTLSGPAQANAGVIKPPAQVDPGIKVPPPIPPAALPTPVIPPPGTFGSNPAATPK